MKLYLDFETRSRVNLITDGAYKYATDPSTEFLCCGFIFGDFEHIAITGLWHSETTALPREILDAIADPTVLIAAHNANFDRLIWNNVATRLGWPEIPTERWYCTAAQMRINNLPSSLEDAARALDASVKKDHKGKALIKALSIPNADGTFNEDPVMLAQMCAYCMTDVKAMKGISEATAQLTDQDMFDYFVNEEINDYGVMIDKLLAIKAQDYAAAEIIEIAAALKEATGGVIKKHTQTVAAAKWLHTRLAGKPEQDLLVKYVEGEPKISLDKQIRQTILDGVEQGVYTLDIESLTVIQQIHNASASSVAKYKNMAQRANGNDRVQGAFMFAGASQTRRYSSKGLQIHNFPSRGLYPTEDETWAAYDRVMNNKDLDVDGETTMGTLKKLLRHSIMSPQDRALVVGDWSSVEARVLPWLSDSEGGDEKLNTIEEIDTAKRQGKDVDDIYVRTAIAIGHPDNRKLGKVCELALGYQGGIGAFQTFAAMEGLAIPEGEAKGYIDTWRGVNQWAVEFWRTLEQAAIKAIRNPDTFTDAGAIRFCYVPTLIEGTLEMHLPDGNTVLRYPKARLEKDGRRTVITAMASSIPMGAEATEWPREALYGGKFAGHATQGTAACLLKELLRKHPDSIAHVHDEVVLEVPEKDAAEVSELLQADMEEPPTWATGLPLFAVPETMYRYTK